MTKRNYFEVFNNDNLGSLKAAKDEAGNVMFRLNDVCDILHIGNQYNTANFLKNCEGMTKTSPIVVLEETREASTCKKDGTVAYQTVKANYVTETGLYLIIFHSNKPQAMAFTIWVAEEVLPRIREHSAYVMGEENMSEEEQEEVHREMSSIVRKHVKSNPLQDFWNGTSYIAHDGTVFLSREDCVDYEKAFREY